jgi:hypothetical protein
MLTARFDALDTYTTKPNADKGTSPSNVQTEEANELLDQWELNTKYQMWEAKSLIDSYGKDLNLNLL